tara:strand:- start:812 stop:1414 length:603 start_codon:yes stop_codon:yes gene_type:complete
MTLINHPFALDFLSREEKREHKLEDIIKKNLVEINTPDPVTGHYPIHLASIYNNLAFIKVLLKLGANINSQNANKQTALHLAIKLGYEDIPIFLIKSGANTSLVDICGNIPLHYAVSFGGNTVFDYVLFATNNINVVNEDCENALHLTPQNRTTYKAAMLIQSGIYINQLNIENKTPLSRAIYFDNFRLCWLLSGSGGVC